MVVANVEELNGPTVVRVTEVGAGRRRVAAPPPPCGRPSGSLSAHCVWLRRAFRPSGCPVTFPTLQLAQAEAAACAGGPATFAVVQAVRDRFDELLPLEDTLSLWELSQTQSRRSAPAGGGYGGHAAAVGDAREVGGGGDGGGGGGDVAGLESDAELLASIAPKARGTAAGNTRLLRELAAFHRVGPSLVRELASAC